MALYINFLYGGLRRCGFKITPTKCLALVICKFHILVSTFLKRDKDHDCSHISRQNSSSNLPITNKVFCTYCLPQEPQEVSVESHTNTLGNTVIDDLEGCRSQVCAFHVWSRGTVIWASDSPTPQMFHCIRKAFDWSQIHSAPMKMAPNTQYRVYK